MAKERLFNLPETKGTYQLRGNVNGTDKDSFYTEKKTSKGGDMRTLNFGVEVEDKKTVYVSMMAFPREEVCFNKPSGEKGKKGETVKVKWAERHTFKRDGFRMIGMNVGVTKTTDEKGNLVNDKKTVTEFDACKLVGDNLKDNESVFVRGKLDYSSYKNDKGEVRRSTKLVPNQISLCGKVDFNDDKFTPTHDFTQTIVFMGIEAEVENEKRTGRFILSAKIVNYASIEDAQFIIADKDLANIFRKNLKPYTAITVWGKLDANTSTEEVESDDCWGESNAMTKVSAPTKRELVITGADKNSIDTTIYTKDLMEEAMLKIQNAANAKTDFGDSSSSDGDAWGSVNSSSTTEDDDVW